MKNFDIEKEIGLYKLRDIENRDMELQIKELELRDGINPMNYEERVQSSTKCKNNDSIMNLIESLKKKIKFNEISNKRVDNILSILEKEDFYLVKRVLIEKESKSQVAKDIFKSRKTIDRAVKKALKTINEKANFKKIGIDFAEELKKEIANII